MNSVGSARFMAGAAKYGPSDPGTHGTMNKDIFDMFGRPIPDIGTPGAPSLCALCDEFGEFAGFAPGHGAVNLCQLHMAEWVSAKRPQLWGWMDHKVNQAEEQKYYVARESSAKAIGMLLFSNLAGINVKWANHLAWVFVETTLWNRAEGEYPLDTMQADLVTLANQIGPEGVHKFASEEVAKQKAHEDSYRNRERRT